MFCLVTETGQPPPPPELSDSGPPHLPPSRRICWGFSSERLACQLLFWGAPPSLPPQEEREKRRLEQLGRKKELQRLLEEEDAQLKGKVPKPPGPARVTRAQIDEALQKELKESGDAAGGGEWLWQGAAGPWWGGAGSGQDKGRGPSGDPEGCPPRGGPREGDGPGEASPAQTRPPPSFRPFLGGGCWGRSSRLKLAIPSRAEKSKSHLEVPLEENLNRRVLEEGAVEARTIEEAIAVLRWGWAGSAGGCRGV